MIVLGYSCSVNGPNQWQEQKTFGNENTYEAIFTKRSILHKTTAKDVIFGPIDESINLPRGEKNPLISYMFYDFSRRLVAVFIFQSPNVTALYSSLKSSNS